MPKLANDSFFGPNFKAFLDLSKNKAHFQFVLEKNSFV